MCSSEPVSQDQPLDALRRQIDEIDDSIHDLLMRRCGLVEDIRRIKGQERVYLRPGREALILRRLAARHEGRFPLPVLVRMWREMIAGFTQLQGPFAVAVYAPEGRRDLWDLARDHYGSSTPITAVGAPVQAVRAVIDGTATIAVVPWPDNEDPDPWWRALTSQDPKTPQVVARLPFVVSARDGIEGGALALAQINHEATGDDHTMVYVELAEPISRGRLKEALEVSGLRPVAFWTRGAGDPPANPPPRPLHLVEIDDYVAMGDARLDALIERLGPAGQRVHTIGGFSVPIRIDMASARRPRS